MRKARRPLVASLRDGNSTLLEPIDLSITARLADSGSRRKSLPSLKKAIKNGIHRVTLILLKKLESRNPLLVEHNNLPIKKEGDGFENPDGRRNSRKLVGSVFCVSGEQPDAIVFLVRKDPVAIVLLLIDPPGPVERLGNKGSQHRLNPKWNPFRHSRRPLLATGSDTVALATARASPAGSPSNALVTSPPSSLAISASRRWLATERGSACVTSFWDAY